MTVQQDIGAVLSEWNVHYRHIPITPQAAQRYLSLVDAATAVRVIRETATNKRDIRAPYPYILAILKAGPPPPVPVRAGAESYTPGDDLPAPTPEYLAQVARLERKRVKEWDKFNEHY